MNFEEKMKVFWSWQSDSPFALNKNFVKDALQNALEIVASDLGLTEPERPEIDHDTKDEPGLVEIVATIFKKIEAASVFVGDVTPVAKTEAGKFVPNPNVMIELGHALKSLGHERVVLVANSAFGGRPEDLPFDLRHRRGPITYKLSLGASAAERSSAKKQLTKDLANALRANLGAALSKRDAEAEFALFPSREGDRSTWLQPGARIEHHDFFNEAGNQGWTVTEGTRAYFRIAPASWSKPKPSRRDVQEMRDEKRLWAYGHWVNGDGGANDLGVVAVGLDGREPGAVHAVTQWFDKTGEVWGFNSRVTDEQSGKVFLGQYRILKDWATFLNKSLAFLLHVGAIGPFRLEAGVVGLTNVYWAGPPEDRARALEPEVVISRQDREWGPEAKLEFLTLAYNQLCDSFNRPRVTSQQVGEIVGKLPE